MEKKLNKKEKFFIVLVLEVITIFSIVIKYYSMPNTLMNLLIKILKQLN